MTPRMTLTFSSIAFAVLWTLWMLWWSAPLALAQTVILLAAGAVAGILWHWLFGLWFRWYFGLDRDFLPRS